MESEPTPVHYSLERFPAGVAVAKPTTGLHCSPHFGPLMPQWSLPCTIGRALARREDLAARSLVRTCELWDTPPPDAETMTVSDALIFYLLQHKSREYARPVSY